MVDLQTRIPGSHFVSSSSADFHMRLYFLLALATCCDALAPHAYSPLPVGSVTPKGWLLKQLTLQAEGLSGHLSQFWNDIQNSIWIGGSGDGGLHERTPYWLNGVVPLAFLLANAGVTELGPFVGIYKAPWGKHGWMSQICTDGVDMSGADIASPQGYGVPTPEKCRDDCAARQDCYGFVIANCTSPPTCEILHCVRPPTCHSSPHVRLHRIASGAG
jgi:hypothetical protein